VSDQPAERVELDGGPPTVEQLTRLALHGYGHFTAMQVRERKVRGLAAHLDRLTRAHREMFGEAPDPDRIRWLVRHALADTAAASVRVLGTEAGLLVTVRPPAPPLPEQRLRSVPYQRPLPHLKQIGGGFGQTYYRNLVHPNGYTDALLTGRDGTISECGIANVAFVDHVGVLWPNAPALAGITMTVLEPRLAAGGLPSRRGPVRLADVPGFRAAFVTNSHGVAPVTLVDDVSVPVDVDLVKTLDEIYETVPWDRI
jgi:branched-subunit amino acid aminotransferase/4-amino-4-deoxychorismate lyase